MLLGRDRELAELTAALSRLRPQGGCLFLFAGEPGIGKSRLAAEIASRAAEHGVAAAFGRCWEAGGAPAFWPWRELCDALAIEFPEPGSLAASDPTQARFALYQAMARSLGQAAASRPLLLVLEDLHAADRSTLLLLEFLAGQLRTMPVAVVGTYRELEAGLRADAADCIARLARAGRVLQLARLGAPEVAALVRDAVEGADEQMAAAVFDITHGNPLFVGEVVRDIRAHGQRSGVPIGVREVIRERLALLPGEARAVLEACAVLGVELVAADVASMMPGAQAVLDDAVKGGVLVPRGGRLRFSHALYREALYFDLPAARRQALHRDAARALGRRAAPLAELAHHLLEAGPESAGAAIEHAIRAAEHAADTFAFEDAVALLERARAAIPSGSGHTEAVLRCRVTIALGETRIRSGDAEGRSACVEAAQTARALGDFALLAQAGLAYGTVLLTGGVDPVLVGMLEEALAGLPAAPSPLRARVMARLAAARQPSPPADRMRDVELGLAAIDMARRVAEGRELLGVLHAAAGVIYPVVDPAIRTTASLEQERLAEQLGDTARLLAARVRLMWDHLERADFTSYAQLADSYEQLARRIGPAAAPWRVPLMRSMIAIAQDRWQESERLQAEARRIDAEQPRARRAQAFHRIGFLRAAERHAELRAAIPELRGLWLAMPYGRMLADAHVSTLLARIGADDELRALLAQLPGGAIDEEINACALAEAAWATGDEALAARLWPLLQRYTERWHVYWFDCEMVDGPNTRILAYVAAVLDRWDECDRLFARALSSVEAVGWRSLAARMRFELGDLLARKRREPARARELIAAAREQAGALGLAELVALIDRRHPDAAAPPPAAARVPRPSRPPFAMVLEGEYYAVQGTRGTLRFKRSRGMQYLAALVERPHTALHVFELIGAGERADRGDAGELLAAAAPRAYRERLAALRDAAEDAQARGDAERAERARGEMEAIAAELARGTRPGGHSKRAESAVDRARSAVQRRIKDALERIAEQDPELGAWLKRAISTGNYCSYRPDA